MTKRRLPPAMRQGLSLEGVSTPGHGEGEGPVGYKFSRSEDAGDDGRGRNAGRRRRPNGVPPETVLAAPGGRRLAGGVMIKRKEMADQVGLTDARAYQAEGDPRSGRG